MPAAKREPESERMATESREESDLTCKVWVLRSPKGKLIPQTIAVHKENAQIVAFDYLYALRRHAGFEWTSTYWKQWDPFIKERKRRGWLVVRATVSVEYAATE